MTQLSQLAEVRRLATPDSATRGFTVNLGDVERSQAATVIDARGFVDEAGAMGSVGKAVSNVAQGIQEITLAMNASVNRRKIDEVDAQIRSAEMDLSMKLAKEKDPRKWQQMFIEEHGAWNKTLLADKTLSPDARDAIESKLNAWRMTGERDVVRKAYDRGLQLETEGLEADRITAAASGNFAASYAATDEMVKRGLIGEDTAARQRAHTQGMVDAAAKEARLNDTITITRTHGREKAQEYIDASGADPIDQERMRSTADEIHREQIGADGDAFEQAVYSGELSVPGEVDAWKKDNPRITARMREQFKRYIIGKNNTARKEQIAARADELSSLYLSEVKQLDPDTATDEDFNALRLKIRELPEGAAEIPYMRLMSKFRKSEAPRPGVIEAVEDELHGYYEAGLFGDDKKDPKLMHVPFAAEDVYTAEELKAMTPEQRATQKDYIKAIEEENKKTQARIDANAKIRKAKIGGEVRKFIDANPKAPLDEALKFMRTKLPDSTRAAMFDAFDPSPSNPANPPAGTTVEGNGAQNDLPTGGGPVENTLLPPLLSPITQ